MNEDLCNLYKPLIQQIFVRCVTHTKIGPPDGQELLLSNEVDSVMTQLEQQQ
jgi:hypothetical protein